LDELLRCCQRFDVQWIRLTLFNVHYPINFHCTTSSVRFQRYGQSTSSDAYFGRFNSLEIRKNEGKKIKMSIFNHAECLWLQMDADGLQMA
jgi:hypothetical protein